VSTLTKAGRYELREELGRGAMGVVYRGYDPVIGRDVAVKTIRLSEAGTGMSREELVTRFQTEARAAGLLTHPNIVVVYDAGEEEGVFYITMEIVEGRSLQTLLDAGQLFPLPRVLRLMEQACSALDFAHQRNVVHRDIKPANLVLTEDDTLKITDFGTAKILQFGTAQTAHVMGTPSYMSPEQVKGKPVDGRTDIFSLGVILYELMTGEKPFPGQNITTVIYKIVNENPIPPRSLDSSIHPGLSAVVERALAKDPAVRFQTCHELLEALKNYRDMVSPEAAARVSLPAAHPAAQSPQASAADAEPRPAAAGFSAQPPAISGIEDEEAARKRGRLVLTGILLAIVGFAGYRIWPAMTDLWQRMHHPAEIPAAPVNKSIATPTGKLESPDLSPKLASPNGTRTTGLASAGPEEDSAPPPGRISSGSGVSAGAAAPVPTIKHIGYAEGSNRTHGILITSRPAGANIFINGQLETQRTPTTISLSPGTYKIAVRKPGFQPYSKVYVVGAGGPGQLSMDLAPAEAGVGWVWVRSVPAGANIQVDGNATGFRTPAQIEMPQGQHEVRLTLNNFGEARRIVLVRQGENILFDEQLEKQ
jgi:predicted Ser/Thr protein kinase